MTTGIGAKHAFLGKLACVACSCVSDGEFLNSTAATVTEGEMTATEEEDLGVVNNRLMKINIVWWIFSLHPMSTRMC